MNLLFLFVASRIVFFLFAFFAASIIPLKEGYLGWQIDQEAHYLTWIWANFDGRHYINIATLGYRNFDFAFFPLYPALIHVTSLVLPFSPLFLGILISIVSFLGALFVLQRIVLLDYKISIASLTVFLLCVFPVSFFYQAVYPDSLFLLLSTTSFYFARKRMWLVSGVFAFLTCASRLSGLALIPALVAEWYLQNKQALSLSIFFKPAASSIFLGMLGFLSYLLYLDIFHGDFLLFQKSMVAWRQNEFVFPLQVIFRYLKIFLLVDKNLLEYWIAVLEFFSTVFYFALTVYVSKKIRFSYGVLLFFIFLLPTFTGTFAGMPRYILHTFPGFLGMSLLFHKKPTFVKIIAILFLILGFAFTGLFTRGYFFS